MRAIRSDTSLSSTQKALLWAAVLRSDNDGRDAGRVRASLDLLARDAGLSAKSAERAFKGNQANVLAYFARVERRTRRINLWFNLTTPDAESGLEPLA